MSSFTKTAVPTVLSATGLIGGYSVARATGNRQLGGVVLAAAGAAAFAGWKRNAGAGVASALIATYIASFGLSHPLAKKIGAWPSVYSVTAATALASATVGRARRPKTSIEQVAENFKKAAKRKKK